MARSRGAYRGRPQSSGVARDWATGPGGTGVTTLTASGVAILGSGVSPGAAELTVMRTRGVVDMFLLGSGAADGDGFFGAIGLGKCTNAAFDVGVGSVPTPLAEVDWDGWYWHQFFSVHNPDITFGGSPAVHYRAVIDSKAMRKFDFRETLYAAIEVVEIGTATLNVFLDTRMLVQDSGR